MIQNLIIKNFKSIKELTIPCKKLNIFIGEPNSGKSNIIEALNLQGRVIANHGLNRNIFRYNTISDFFTDFNTSQPVEVILDQIPFKISFATKPDGSFDNSFHIEMGLERKLYIELDHNGSLSIPNRFKGSSIMFYDFRPLVKYPKSLHQNLLDLLVPYGENLASLLLTNGDYKSWVTDFLKSKGFRLNFKPNENEILFSKMVGDEIFSFSFFMLSETLQRIIFYTIAIKSNKNSVILFDEPETNTFPPYTKELAERIADDETNQFFITTHDPYLLLNLIEKTKVEDLHVFITEMKDYKTVAHLLNNDQISEVLSLDSDVFFNFERILG